MVVTTGIETETVGESASLPPAAPPLDSVPIRASDAGRAQFDGFGFVDFRRLPRCRRRSFR